MLPAMFGISLGSGSLQSNAIVLLVGPRFNQSRTQIVTQAIPIPSLPCPLLLGCLNKKQVEITWPLLQCKVIGQESLLLASMQVSNPRELTDQKHCSLGTVLPSLVKQDCHAPPMAVRTKGYTRQDMRLTLESHCAQTPAKNAAQIPQLYPSFCNAMPAWQLVTSCTSHPSLPKHSTMWDHMPWL